MRTSLLAVGLVACIEACYVLVVGRAMAGFSPSESAHFALHLVGVFALCGIAVALAENLSLAVLLRVDNSLASARLTSTLLAGSMVALLLPAALFAMSALSGSTVAYGVGGAMLVSGTALIVFVRSRTHWLAGLNAGALRFLAYSLLASHQVLSLALSLSLFARMQDAHYATLAAECFALLVVACWALAFCLRWIGDRKREGGWSAASSGTVIVGAVVALALTIGVYMSDRFVHPGLYGRFHWFLRLPMYLAAQATIIMGAEAFSRLPRSQHRLPVGKVLGGIAAALSLAAAGHSVSFYHYSERVAQACLSEALVTAELTMALRSFSDSDGDGYSSLFGGDDCDDSNPEVHPGRREILDNGIDDNCHGGDLTNESLKLKREGRLAAQQARTRWWHSRPEASGRRLNLVVVSIDSLRADHVGCYGYERETTPQIDNLARDSVVFRNAYCAGGITSISLPSLMTGVYPSAIGFTNVYEDSQFRLWFLDRLPSGITPNKLFNVPARDTHPTLSQRLGKAGYYTVAVLNDGETDYFRPEFGFSRGFDKLCSNHGDDCMGDQSMHQKGATAERFTQMAIRQLDEIPTGPFFMWIHHFDPHSYWNHTGRTPWGNTELDKYDSEIAFADRHLGLFFDELARRGRMKDTIVVVASDHGQAFGEHGTYLHGLDGHEEQIHVPLLIRLPGVRPRDVTEPVSLVDVVPTLLDYLGVDSEEPFSGRSLLPDIFGDHVGNEDGAVSMCWRNQRDGTRTSNFITLVRGRNKLSYDEIGNHFAMYDLLSDPNELVNLAGSQNATFLSMRKSLLDLIERDCEGCISNR
jgi:choline-sulfatase